VRDVNEDAREVTRRKMKKKETSAALGSPVSW